MQSAATTTIEMKKRIERTRPIKYSVEYGKRKNFLMKVARTIPPGEWQKLLHSCIAPFCVIYLANLGSWCTKYEDML